MIKAVSINKFDHQFKCIFNCRVKTVIMSCEFELTHTSNSLIDFIRYQFAWWGLLGFQNQLNYCKLAVYG